MLLGDVKTIHYRYAIGFLIILLIEVLTGWWYRIPDLTQLLSFGLSLSSLVLAIIAIIQALVAGSSLSGIVTTITNLVGEVRSAAGQISDASGQILRHTETIPSALGEMSQRVDQALNRFPSPAMAGVAASIRGSDMRVAPGDKSGHTQLILTRSTNGGMIALYACIRSVETGKKIDTLKMFSNDEHFAYYTQGFVAGMACSGEIEIGLEDSILEILDLNLIDAAVVNAEIEAMDSEYGKIARKIVDDFFRTTAP